MLLNLADVARRTGRPVQEVAGWKTRGRDTMKGVKGVICHHTAGPLSGNYPSFNTVLNGRPDVPGPLSQFGLGRDGLIIVFAAGRANHAGVVSHPYYGGDWTLGIEAENTGRGEPWGAPIMLSYRLLVAELAKEFDFAVSEARGHKEVAYPLGRKPDPTFDMDEFRASVKREMYVAPPIISTPKVVSYVRFDLPVLKVGSEGKAVQNVQTLLGVTPADGIFGADTAAAVKAFKVKNNLPADGVVGHGVYSALGYGNRVE